MKLWVAADVQGRLGLHLQTCCMCLALRHDKAVVCWSCSKVATDNYSHLPQQEAVSVDQHKALLDCVTQLLQLCCWTGLDQHGAQLGGLQGRGPYWCTCSVSAVGDHMKDCSYYLHDSQLRGTQVHAKWCSLPATK